MEQLVIRVNLDGTREDLSFQEWLDRGRAWWKTKPGRAVEADQLIVLDSNHTVKAVGKICGVRKDLEQGSGRVSIEVIPTPGSEWIGQTIERGNSRNPVAYMEKLIVIAQV